MDDTTKRIDQLKQELIDLRRDFHMYPELGFKEFRTAGKVESYLKDLGLETSRLAETGVVTVIEGTQPSPVLMLRADMDALPMEEATEVVYKSKNQGVMHACGHDAHMAMLLVAAKILYENRHRLSGSIKLVFQPNEEVAGALKMIEEGVLETPNVNAVMGLHIWNSLDSGKIGITAGTVMGGLDVFKLTVYGKGGHTGSPHEAVDPVMASAAIIQNVQAIQTREISVLKPTLIMFGKIVGGSKANIIPDKVEMEGTIRFLQEPGIDKNDHPSNRFQNMVKKICGLYRCKYEISVETENIPLVNNGEMAQLARATAERVFPKPNSVVDERTIASEDFSEFSSRIPGIFMFLGVGINGKNKGISHHNPFFDIDESVLRYGAEMFVEGAFNFFQNREALSILTAKKGELS